MTELSPRPRTDEGRRARRLPGVVSLAVFLATCASVALSLFGCALQDATATIPSYTCSTADPCAAGTCIEGVCASDTGDRLHLVLRTTSPSLSTLSGVRTYTQTPFEIDASGTHDIVLPQPYGAYGVVRFATGSTPIAAQVSFTRVLAVGGRFIDDIRTFAPVASVGPDGSEADFQVDLASNEQYIVTVAPTSALTPSQAGIPGNLVGKPLYQVFPPVVQVIDPSAGSVGASRYDYVYSDTLFNSCAGTVAKSCTAVGHLVSTDDAGTLVPEAGVRVVLESVSTEQPISTTATTDENGAFVIRISSTREPYRLRVAPSDVRPAFPSLLLPEGAFDAYAGGDVVVPSVSVVHYVARVEYDGQPASYAVVRAIARSLENEAGQEILGARFETTVRTTTEAAADGAGLFALDLVEGVYDIVVTHPGSEAGMARVSATIVRQTDGAAQQGQTFVLTRLVQVGGTVQGPDEAPLPYSTVQWLPYVPWGAANGAEAYARPMSTTTDDASHFTLAADPGYFDLVVSSSVVEGLPYAVLTGRQIGGVSTPSFLPLQVSRATVLTGSLTTHDAVTLPNATVEAYLYVPATTDNPNARTIPIGDATTDASGHYRLLLPSRIDRL